MFKQFLTNTSDYNIYLISSLGIFLVFFILVGLLLTRMKKEEVDYMSSLPLNHKDEADIEQQDQLFGI